MQCDRDQAGSILARFRDVPIHSVPESVNTSEFRQS